MRQINRMSTVFAILLLLAALAPAVASAQQQQGERVHAEAGVHYAMVMAGEVKSIGDDQITLDTETGAEQFRLTDDTVMRADPVPGEIVVVAFQRHEPANIAEVVRPATRRALERAGAVFHEQTVRDDLTTRRTRLPEGSVGGWSGLTVFGEISDVPEEDAIVISTSTGAEHVQLTPDTEVEIDLDEGRRVAADVARSGDALIAYSVRPIEDMD